MIYATKDGLRADSASSSKPTRTQMQVNANKTFGLVYEYIEAYQSRLKDISVEMGRFQDEVKPYFGTRKNWNDYKTEPTVNGRFYQGEFVYFNPDQPGRTDKNVDYYAVNHVIRLLKQCGITQADISAVCNVSTATVSAWMTGTEIVWEENGMEVRQASIKDSIKNNFEYHPVIHPDKYQWWALAIEICLPATHLDPFLMMVGAVFEPFRLEDQIIFSLMRPDSKTRYEPSENSGANVQSELSKNDLNDRLCQEVRLAFHLMRRSEADKTKGKKDKTGD